MKKLLTKCITVILSVTLVLGPVFSQPVKAEENVGEVTENELYATGAYPTDMSKISDDMKIDTIEEYYDVVTNESQISLFSSTDDIVLQNELPDSVDLSTSEYFPAIGNQGSLGACVSFAQTYYQFTYEMNRKMGRATSRENTFSPIYPYSFIANENGTEGALPSVIYGLLKNKGTIPWSNTEYSYDPNTWSPVNEIWEEADNYRIDSYQFLSTNLGQSGHEVSSPDDSDLQVIKTALSNGEMVCISTYIYSWNTISIGENSPHTGEQIVIDVGGTNGYHRMTIVGYDDNIWIDINDDSIVQDAEKGAFKIVNSWGEKENGSEFCWFWYDAINIKSETTGIESSTKSGLSDFTRISVADYDSDSDIKLVYTLNTNSRKELKISVKATDVETGKIYTKATTPYYISDGNSDSRNLYLDGTEGIEGVIDNNKTGTMTMDLDTVVPGITSETFDNYVWTVTFSELKNDGYSTIIHDMEIVDYNTEIVYEFDESYEQTVNGSEIEYVCSPNGQGYDLQVTDISYINLETGEKNGRIEPGDRIRFESEIKNVGDMRTEKNQKFAVLFTADERTVWNSGMLYEERLGLQSSVIVSAVSGEDEGVITFSQTGTYDVTAWANYNNTLSNEYGGYQADNNKKTITIEVLPEEEGIKVTSFTASNEEPGCGDTVTFSVSLKYDITVQTKIDICDLNGTYLYQSDYVDGTEVSYQFDTAAGYYVVATVKDVDTGEEVTVSQPVRIAVKDTETETETGCDLSVETLTYTTIDTNISNGIAYVGDTIKIKSKIKNIGEVNAPDNQTMRISFLIGNDVENIVWSEDYTGKTGLAAGASLRNLEATSGGQNGNGTYTFTEAGVYTITAWINDTNEISGEVDGNVASNNIMTTTIEIRTKESINNIDNYEVDKMSVIQGDAVKIDLSNSITGVPKIRLDIYTESGELYDSIGYQYGSSQKYYFEEVGIYYVQAMIANANNGEKGITAKIPVTVSAADGYDLAVIGLTYVNVDTGQVGGGLKAGDRIRLQARIKNIGNINAPDNTLMQVTYNINDGEQAILYNDQFVNRSGLVAGDSTRLNSNNGGVNGDGIYTITENGTYTFTASVNEDNAFADEICGNTAKNNQKTITVTVAEPEKRIQVNYFEASADEVFAGEVVEFYAGVSNVSTAMMKLHIYGINGMSYNGSYIMGTQASYQFEQEGTYYIQATIVDPTTSEEITTGFITVLVNNDEN